MRSNVTGQGGRGGVRLPSDRSLPALGRGSLFRTPQLNRTFGFLLGVTADMPQYVWSRLHNYHHNHNGNWEKYRGSYTALSVDE
jgi:hypothetical protein